MPLGSLIAGGVTGLMGAATSIQQMIQGSRMRKKAQAFIDNFEPIELSNKFADNQVSTLGADMMMEASAQDFKSRSQDAKAGGMRGIMAMSQDNQTIRDKVTQQVGAGLDAKQKEIDLLASQDEIRMETIKEKRSQDELAGYGAMLNKGQDMGAQGMANLTSAVGGMAGSVGNYVDWKSGDGDDGGTGESFANYFGSLKGTV